MEIMQGLHSIVRSIYSAGLWAIIGLVMFCGNSAKAQQTIVYSQYYDQPILINPAYTGLKDQYNAFLLFRKQMTGIPNSPTTQQFSIDGPIGDKMGIGLNMVNDKTDILGRTQLALSYRYMVKINDKSDLSFGMNGGVGFNRVDFSGVRADDVTDPALLTNNQSQITPQFNVGALYRYERLSAGLSAQNITQQNATFSEQSSFKNLEQKFIRHFIAHVGYDFPINENWAIEPMILGRLMQGGQFQFDINAFANYMDRFWAGLTYREGTSVNVSFGANIVSRFNMGYTYEYYVGDIQQFSNGSHEFQLSYLFGKNSDVANYSSGNEPSDYDQLVRQNRKQAEQIDQLNYRIKDLENELDKKEKKNEETKEIENQIEELKEQLDELKENRVYEDEAHDQTDSAKSTSRKPNNQLDEEELDQIDEYYDENEGNKVAFDELKEELRKNRKQINLQQNEIEKLKSQINDYREELEKLKSQRSATRSRREEGSDRYNENENNKPDDTEKDYLSDVRNADTSDKNYDYHVVLGAYKNLESAQRYQRLLKTDKALDTRIVQSDDGDFFFVTTKQTNDLEAALNELEKKYDQSYKINGNPWVYMKEK
ncbi:PorP/SprF family type IX secretion system membrane protein [Salibacter halophilus]|nr:type IX secretion system membrane protein PorP/SprF [Salibacter halophilus]